jgi:hypothetical protein
MLSSHEVRANVSRSPSDEILSVHTGYVEMPIYQPLATVLHAMNGSRSKFAGMIVSLSDITLKLLE